MLSLKNIEKILASGKPVVWTMHDMWPCTGICHHARECTRYPVSYTHLGLENRTIVSGIAQHYKPEELVGKQVLFIANLAPRQFKNGLVSEGMILSAENYDGSLAVTSLLKEVKPGSEVK